MKANGDNGMMLMVDVDNDCAIALYESMGFKKVRGQNNLTAYWHVDDKG